MVINSYSRFGTDNKNHKKTHIDVKELILIMDKD